MSNQITINEAEILLEIKNWDVGQHLFLEYFLKQDWHLVVCCIQTGVMWYQNIVYVTGPRGQTSFFSNEYQ